MAEYELLTSTFEAGINTYTGTTQGGHTYARIRPAAGGCDLKRLDREITTKVARELDEIETAGAGTTCPGHTFSWAPLVGQRTERLASVEQANELAIAWMKEHHAEDRLVRQYDGEIVYDGEILYDGETPDRSGSGPRATGC